MPAKSKAQQGFMGRCVHKGGKDCPPKKVAREFAKTDKAKKLLPKRAKKAMKSLKDKYSGYAEGGLVTKSGPIADWHTAGRKVRQDYRKKGKRSTR